MTMIGELCQRFSDVQSLSKITSVATIFYLYPNLFFPKTDSWMKLNFEVSAQKRPQFAAFCVLLICGILVSLTYFSFLSLCTI